MQRYFIANEHFRGTTVRITGEDAHHLSRVLRARVGERLICSNGINRDVEVEITEIEQGEVIATVIRDLPLDAEPDVQVWIAQSLPKGDKMDTIIQKCTEIGAVRFIPFLSERTIVQYDRKKEEKRLERWHKIAKEAAEQAHRNRIPVIDGPCSWERLLQLAGTADAGFICYEKENGQLFKDALAGVISGNSAGKLRTIMLVIGPEGGFSEIEIASAEKAGVQSVSLGKRILRTETAAMVGLTCILYESGEMGGQ